MAAQSCLSLQGSHAVSSDTIGRWIKDTLQASGVDTGLFSAHSCRAASTTAASLKGVSLTTIVKSASWSNVKTFKKFYFKDIEQVYVITEENLGTELLKQHTNM